MRTRILLKGSLFGSVRWSSIPGKVSFVYITAAKFMTGKGHILSRHPSLEASRLTAFLRKEKSSENSTADMAVSPE